MERTGRRLAVPRVRSVARASLRCRCGCCCCGCGLPHARQVHAPFASRSRLATRGFVSRYGPRDVETIRYVPTYSSAGLRRLSQNTVSDRTLERLVHPSTTHSQKPHVESSIAFCVLSARRRVAGGCGRERAPPSESSLRPTRRQYCGFSSCHTRVYLERWSLSSFQQCLIWPRSSA